MLLIQMRISRKGQTKDKFISSAEWNALGRIGLCAAEAECIDTQKEDKAAGEPREKGVIVAHGRAKYEWKEDESMNYFVTLKMNMERRHSGERP